jgi:phosphate starvation-inducible PhoH-like protein
MLRELAGELGGNLGALARALDVDVSQRGGRVQVDGAEAQVEMARRVLEGLEALIRAGRPVGPREVDDLLRFFRSDPSADARRLLDQTIVMGLDRKPIGPRSPGQAGYLHAMRTHPLVFGVGPAGTGKTYLAVAVAVAALLKGDVKRLVLTRPAVEAGEKLGFLPGDLAEKVDPYLRPLFDAMGDIIPEERVQKALERRVIEVAPLAFMRGRTLAHAFVILDEAQNTTPVQMKMFLTRMGEGTRMVIAGDLSQVDLPAGTRSGMRDALETVEGVPGIAIARFDKRDVVRHPLVARIVEAYDQRTAAEGETARRRRAAPAPDAGSTGPAAASGLTGPAAASGPTGK